MNHLNSVSDPSVCGNTFSPRDNLQTFQNPKDSINNNLLVTDTNLRPYKEMLDSPQRIQPVVSTSDFKQPVTFLGQEITEPAVDVDDILPSYSARKRFDEGIK